MTPAIRITSQLKQTARLDLKCQRPQSATVGSRTSGIDNSNAKDDFAELRAGFKIGVGFGAGGQGEDAVDDGLEAPRGH